MRIVLSIALSAFLLFGRNIAAAQEEAKKDMGQKEKVSYSFGYDVGRQMRIQSIDVDPEVFIRAFREGLAGDKAAMTDREMIEAAMPFQKKKAEAAAEAKKQIAEKNKKEGEAFLAENALKKGVVTLPSGLQYKVIKEGTGKSPGKSDTVVVHYRGFFVNGNEFDSTQKSGKPATLSLNRVTRGWAEALMLMKEGSKWMLYIPSSLAYGKKGQKSRKVVIGPNQTLIFEVELISVQG